MPASAFPGWEGRKSQSSCRGLNSEFLLFEYFLVQKRSNFYVFIGQSRTPHTETWSASKDHTEPWPWLLENNNCSKIGDSPGNYSSLQTISSLAGVSANTLRAVYLQSIPSPAPVISEHLLLVGEHLCGIKLPHTAHCPQDLCCVQIMAQTDFPFPQGGKGSSSYQNSQQDPSWKKFLSNRVHTWLLGAGVSKSGPQWLHFQSTGGKAVHGLSLGKHWL